MKANYCCVLQLKLSLKKMLRPIMYGEDTINSTTTKVLSVGELSIEAFQTSQTAAAFKTSSSCNAFKIPLSFSNTTSILWDQNRD